MTPRLFCCSVAALLTGYIDSPSAFAQGTLTPPGPPAPTMKTLNQLDSKLDTLNAKAEKRTPISSLPYTISTPGSYELIGNLTVSGSGGGITVAASPVTIDLQGFTLKGGGGGTVAGITVPAQQSSLCVRNGTLESWTNGGVRAELASGSLYQNLRLSHNSGSGNSAGILAGPGSVIQECAAYNQSGIAGIATFDGCAVVNCTSDANTGGGFLIGNNNTISHCTANANTLFGILTLNTSSVLHCTAAGTLSTASANGTGIVAVDGCTIADCTSGANQTYGITVHFGSIVRNCTVRFNGFSGIIAVGGCHIIGNACDQNDVSNTANEAGIFLEGTANRIEGNSCTYNHSGDGIYVLLDHNLIIRNSASGHQLNYSIGPDNVFGQVINQTAASNGGFAGSSAASTLGTTDPWANISY